MSARETGVFIFGAAFGLVLGLGASLTIAMAVDMMTARSIERSWWPNDYLEGKR